MCIRDRYTCPECLEFVSSSLQGIYVHVGRKHKQQCNKSNRPTKISRTATTGASQQLQINESESGSKNYDYEIPSYEDEETYLPVALMTENLEQQQTPRILPSVSGKAGIYLDLLINSNMGVEKFKNVSENEKRMVMFCQLANENFWSENVVDSVLSWARTFGGAASHLPSYRKMKSLLSTSRSSTSNRDKYSQQLRFRVPKEYNNNEIWAQFNFKDPLAAAADILSDPVVVKNISTHFHTRYMQMVNGHRAYSNNLNSGDWWGETERMERIGEHQQNVTLLPLIFFIDKTNATTRWTAYPITMTI